MLPCAVGSSLLVACAERQVDRADSIQIPLALLVLFFPLLSPLIAIFYKRYLWWLLLAQLGIFLLHESGVSVQSNVRVDYPFYFLSFLVHAFVLAWLSRKRE